MALVNPALSPIVLAAGAGKDSRWLTLEVCREFARSKCSRTDEECKYAHPPPHVEIQNGRVTCCFDSIKGKCQRKDPPCKYLHPPQHLKEILLQNGRQNLILKNLQMQTTTLQPTAAVVQLPGGVYPVIYESLKPVVHAPPAAAPSLPSAPHPSYASMVVPTGQYLTLVPPGASNHPYLMQSPMGYTYYNPQSIGNFPTIIPAYDNGGTFPVSIGTSQMIGSLSGTSVVAAMASGLTQHMVDSTPSSGKQLENSSVCSGSPSSSLTQRNGQPVLPWDGSSSPSNSVIAVESANLPYCQPVFYKRQMVEVMAAMGRKRPHEISSSVASADDLILGVNTVPGVVPVLKRPALIDPKSGLPVYQQYAAAATYPSALTTLRFQQQPHFVPITIAGAAPVIPRIN